MSPIYLNPQTSSPIPFLELKGDQQHNNFQVFGHVHDHDLATTTTTNSCLSYNNSHNSQEMLSFDYSRNAYSKVEKLVVSHEKTSDLSQPYTSWLHQSTIGDNSECTYDYSFHLHQGVEKIENDDDDDVRNNKYHDDDDDDHDHHHDIKYSKKWKPSKVRIMQKMMTSTFKNSGNNTKQQQLDHLPKQQRQNNGDGIRVCSDCHTTTTPLWRSGPQGPKSLCNACGIRQRKARRAAMAAAAAAGFDNDTAAAITPPPTPSPRVEARKSTNKAQDQIMKQERGLQYHDKTHTLPIKKRSKLIDATRNNKNNYTQNSYNNNNNNNNYNYNNNNNNNNNYNYNNNNNNYNNNNNNEEEEEKKGYNYEEEMAMSTNKDYYAKPNNPKRGSFPRDEEEGAILLMALSCGLACSS